MSHCSGVGGPPCPSLRDENEPANASITKVLFTGIFRVETTHLKGVNVTTIFGVHIHVLSPVCR